MSFLWSKKFVKVVPAIQVLSEEIVQKIDLPTIHDKISSIEHKNGEQMVNARQKDDEKHEVQGDLQKG